MSCQAMGRVSLDPEESVRLAHPPLRHPLRDEQIHRVYAGMCREMQM